MNVHQKNESTFSPFIEQYKMEMCETTRVSDSHTDYRLTHSWPQRTGAPLKTLAFWSSDKTKRHVTGTNSKRRKYFGGTVAVKLVSCECVGPLCRAAAALADMQRTNGSRSLQPVRLLFPFSLSSPPCCCGPFPPHGR